MGGGDAQLGPGSAGGVAGMENVWSRSTPNLAFQNVTGKPTGYKYLDKREELPSLNVAHGPARVGE